MLAPAVAALVGIGVVALWTEYRSLGWSGWILPITLSVTAGLQTQVLMSYSDWYSWMSPAIVILCFGAIAGLAAVRLVPRLKGTDYALAALSVGMVSLFIAPSLWAASTIWYGGETRAPTAGPRTLGDRGASGKFVRDAVPLLDYLRSHKGAAKYLVASSDQDFARYAILNTNDPVIAFGGFTGNDPVVSTERLVGLVNDGEVRFFLLEPTNRQRTRVSRGIAQQCKPVPKEAWQPDPSSSRRDAKGIVNPLYECGGASDDARPSQ